MPWFKPFLAACILIGVGSSPAVLADHPQPIENDDTNTITFDHRGGNEWWVEVKVTVYDVHSVYARTETGDWHRLALEWWGNWAASFHIPPGERVQFQAAYSGSGGRFDIYRETSCFFTHPTGAEQCDPGPTDDYRVTFCSPGGNEWWQQVFVDANRPVTRVMAALWTVDGWMGKALSLRSWGAWAGSYQAPQGTTVQFWANNNAEGERSECYRWTTATVIECPQSPSVPTSAFMTRFDHKTGNEWWVEVLVGPVKPTRVAAQDDGGSWQEVTFRSWGAWAGSFPIEPGHRVHFRALVEGDWWESCWFTHPRGLTPEGNQVCDNTFVGDWSGP